ncbi:MAG: hypothetical protein K2X81_05735, partial [Candidatus Obscuribacterales bacterium]|nr:hypothetical protein [Candidatus Obscuribacterales bacterium]
FLIDRDHCTDAEVERSWTDFPDPDKHNLLIWKKRQLENYFLDPGYLSKSEFLKTTREQLNASLLKHAANRIYLDLANLTITQIREFQKEKWIAQFSNPAEFESAAIALKKVKECPEIRSRARIIADHLATVETIFQKFQQKLIDGAVKPVFGKGEWLNLMDGKALYCTIVNECFKVTDADGKELKGKDAQKTLALDLLQKGLTEQPKDFQDLHKMVKTLTTRAIRG